jgi:hypothetical protein
VATRVVAVRHQSGDRLVAVIEIVSPGNKDSVHAVRFRPEGRGDAGDGVAAYVVTAGVGETLPTMPLFLLPGVCVEVPLEPSYHPIHGGVEAA